MPGIHCAAAGLFNFRAEVYPIDEVNLRERQEILRTPLPPGERWSVRTKFP